MTQEIIFKVAGVVGSVACVLKNLGTLAKAGYQHGYEAALMAAEKTKEETK